MAAVFRAVGSRNPDPLSDDSNEDLVKKYAVRPDGTSSLRLPGRGHVARSRRCGICAGGGAALGSRAREVLRALHFGNFELVVLVPALPAGLLSDEVSRVDPPLAQRVF